jgi:hypothetical protein
MAMAAHHHTPRAPTAPLPASLSGAGQHALWLLAAPLAFYLAWQAFYFVAVQLVAKEYVRSRDLDTSYRCLSRRARRTRNVWARIVLQGGLARRLAMYGLLQLAFTGKAHYLSLSGLYGLLFGCCSSGHGQPQFWKCTTCQPLPCSVLSCCSWHFAPLPAHLPQRQAGLCLAGCQGPGARSAQLPACLPIQASGLCDTSSAEL